MALKDFLYLCPACGHAPTAGQGDRVFCPGCGTRVDREGAWGTRLRVRSPDGHVRHLQAALLADRIAGFGGALRRARRANGEIHAEAHVRLRVAGGEEPVRYRGRLLGFAERFTGGAPGTLTLTSERIAFVPRSDRLEGPGPSLEGGQGTERSWPLEEILALQTSSSAIQLTTPGRGRAAAAPGVALFRFDEASPREWDELLRATISSRREALGLGRVIEFQPRIRGEAPVARWEGRR